MGQERNTAAEISTEYIDTLSKVYYSYFKYYDSRLMKLSVIFFIFYKVIIYVCFCIKMKVNFSTRNRQQRTI